MNDYNSNPIYFNSLEEYNKKTLRSACNKTGFLIVIATIAMNIAAIILQLIIIFVNKSTDMSTSALYLLNGLYEFTGFFIVPLIYCFIAKIQLRDALPFEPCKGRNIILLITAGYAICTVSNYAVTILNSNLSLFNFTNSATELPQTVTTSDNIIYFISIAVVPALTEEFIFRGVLLYCLRQFGDGFAIITTSILFSLMHGNFVQIPFAFIVGLVLGTLVVKTNSMLPAILMHLLNNSTSVILDIAESFTNEAVYSIVCSAVIFILTLLGFISIIILSGKGFSMKFGCKNNTFDSMKISGKIACFFTNPGTICASSLFILSAIFNAAAG